MASVVDICNIALSHVGGGRIVSLDDPQEQAAQCLLHYALARDKVLGEREWTFAVTRRQLAEVTPSPQFGFPRAFQVPSDSIRILRCFEDSDLRFPIEQNTTFWYREGDTIVTNSEQIYCQYIRRVEDPNAFSPGFVQALATFLAHKLSIPLTQNSTLSERLLLIHEEELARAATADGLQGKHRTINFSRLINMRRR